MIKRFTVQGLNGRLNHDLVLNPDINIITGKNGSGKTTLLKLLWYMVSPNIERTIPEIQFSSAKLQTDLFSLEITRRQVQNKDEIVSIVFSRDPATSSTVELSTTGFEEPWNLEKVEEVNKQIMEVPTGSIFFPTFRRIEGGFSLESSRRIRYFPSPSRLQIGEVMGSYSETMTVKQHRFVASISTSDIEDLLTRQYAEVSEKTNKLHTELSQFISRTISSKHQENNERGASTASSEPSVPTWMRQ